MEPGEVIFENTFARACTNRRLTVDEIIEGMKFGAFHYDLLPIEVRDAVDRALEHEDALAAERGTHDPYHDGAWELDLLDVGLGPAQKGAAGSPYPGSAPGAHTKAVEETMSMHNDAINDTLSYQWSRAMTAPVPAFAQHAMHETLEKSMPKTRLVAFTT